MKNTILKLFLFTSCLLLFSVYIFAQKDYYWVGGSGVWNSTNAANWATTSGGTQLYNQVPTPQDNVIFDENSGFEQGDNTLEIASEVYCYNMTWSNVPNSPNIKIEEEDQSPINIYGSLSLQKDMLFVSGGRFIFKGTGKHTIKTNGFEYNPSGYGSLYFTFNGSGEWKLLDDFVGKIWIVLNKGTFNTNEKKMSINIFQVSSENKNDLIKIDMRKSEVIVKNIFSPSDIEDENQLTLLADGSVLTTGRCDLTSFPARLNKVILYDSNGRGLLEGGSKYISGFPYIKELVLKSTSKGTLQNNIEVDNLIIEKGFIADLQNNFYLKVNKSFQAAGERCGEAISLQSRISDSNVPLLSTFEIAPSASVTAKGLVLQGIKSINPLTAEASTDLGRNTNITFNTPPSKTFYWIGGSGNWSDKAHWTVNADGTPGDVSCVPSEVDDVIFNENSGFSLISHTVILDDKLATCRDMTWKNAPHSPIFKYDKGVGKRLLTLTGSLLLQADMSYEIPTLFASSGTQERTITTNNATKGECYFDFVNDGIWHLKDNVLLEKKGIDVHKGKLYTDGHNITAKHLYIRNDSYLNIRGSTVRVNEWKEYYTIKALVETANSVIYIHPTLNESGGKFYLGKAGHFEANSKTNIYEKIVLSKQFLFNLDKDAYTTNLENDNIEYYKTYFECGNYKKDGTAKIKTLISEYNTQFYRDFVVDNLEIRGKDNVFEDSRSTFIYVANSLIIKGENNCNKRLLLTARSIPKFVLEQGATTDLSYAQVSFIDANRELIFENSVDAGFNGANIKFSTQTHETYYWVGGSGNWSDLSHWTRQATNRTYPANDVSCLPTPNTNVVFDAQSGFSNGNSAITVAEKAFCKNMSWENTIVSPSLLSKEKLSIYGSLWIRDDLSIIEMQSRDIICFYSSKNEELHLNLSKLRLLEPEGTQSNSAMSFSFFGEGRWTLDADFEIPRLSLSLYGGSMNFSNRNILIASFSASMNNYGYKFSREVDLNNAQIVIGIPEISEGYAISGSWYVDYSQFSLKNAGNSSIVFKSQQSSFKHRCFTYNNGCELNKYKSIIFEGAKKASFEGSAQKVDSRSSELLVKEAYIDTLILQPGSKLNINESGSGLSVKKQAYLSGVLNCVKTRVLQYSAYGSFSKEHALLNIQGGTTDFTNIEIEGIDGSGAHQTITMKESVDRGRNKNINISAESATSSTFGGLGPDVVLPTYPLTLTTNKFYPTPNAKYEWNDGSTSSTLTVNAPGAYSVKVTYSNGCVRNDEVLIGKFKAPPILDCVRVGDDFISGEGYAGSEITATVSGTTYTTTVQQDNTWRIENLANPLVLNQEFNLTQNINGLESDPLTHTVIVASGEPQTLTATLTPGPGGSINVNEQVGYQYSRDGITWTEVADYNNLDIGTYSITAQLKNSPKCTSVTVFEIEDDIPVITPGFIDLCLGYDQQLTSSIQGGNWKIEDTNIATINETTGLITPKAVGTTSATYTTQYNHTASIKVFVNDGSTNAPVVLTPEPPTCVVLGDTYSYTFTAEGKKVTARTLPNGFSFKQGDMKVSTLTSNLNIRMQMETASIVADSKGNIFAAGFSQNGNGLIIKVTPYGTRTLYAGSETEAGERDGALSQALLSPISYMTIDSEDNLYVAQGTKVKKINTKTNILETFVDTQGRFPGQNFGLTADDVGNIYFQKFDRQSKSSSINKISPRGVISEHLTGIKAVGSNFQIDNQGNFYIPDIFNPEGGRIPRIVRVASNGTTKVIAGGVTRGTKDGVGTEAQFDYPSKPIVDESKNIYIMDMDPNTGILTLLRKVSATGVVTTVDNLQLEGVPIAVTISEGDLIIADMNIKAGTISLKKVSPSNYTISSTGAVPEGTYSYTLAVAGKCGDSEKVVTLEAGKPKFTNCPENQEVEVAAGTTSATVSWTPPTATDCCGAAATLTTSHNPNDSFNIGVTTVTYTATDKNNNTATCSFAIKVSDYQQEVNLSVSITAKDATCSGSANGKCILKPKMPSATKVVYKLINGKTGKVVKTSPVVTMENPYTFEGIDAGLYDIKVEKQ